MMLRRMGENDRAHIFVKGFSDILSYFKVFSLNEAIVWPVSFQANFIILKNLSNHVETTLQLKSLDSIWRNHS